MSSCPVHVLFSASSQPSCLLFPLQAELPMTTVLERGLVSEKIKWKDMVNKITQMGTTAHTLCYNFTCTGVTAYSIPPILYLPQVK